MIYKSKIDKWLVVLCFGVTFIVVLPMLFIDFVVWDILVPIILFAFIGDMFCNTEYIIYNHILKVKCGFFLKNTYDIGEIKKIEESHSWESAPALSISRLRITFYDGKSVLISPKEKEKFIEMICHINSEVIVEGL